MKYLSNLLLAFVVGFYMVIVQHRAPTELWALFFQALPALLAYQLWLHFAAVMNVARVLRLGQLSTFNSRMGTAAEVIGLVLDALFNVFAFFLFFEWQREWLFSGRVTRLIANDAGWRGDRALWWRVNVLDYLDSLGIHKG